MISRRRFLTLGTLAGASFLIPKMLKSLGTAVPPATRKLIVIQLSGGNDGLNTVIPFRNDHYYSSRPTVAIPRPEVLRLSDELGLHPELRGLWSLFDEGQVCVLNGVGYPEQSRSHFQSMDIWHSGMTSGGQQTGWLGRYADLMGEGATLYELDGTTSLAVKGVQSNGFVFGQGSDRYLPQSGYPNSTLGHRLSAAAASIRSGSPATVYFISHGSFDTHVAQRENHAKLLGQLDEALLALVRDLKSANCFKDTLIVTVSEFGRRLEENVHRGTDHGAASSMFVLGGGLARPGIYNELPDLGDTDDGGLKHAIDFRQIYATVLDRWLGSDSSAILGASYEKLSFV